MRGGAARANQQANCGISSPLWLLSAASLFYSVKACAVSTGGERSTAVISAWRRRGVYQGDSANGACINNAPLKRWSCFADLKKKIDFDWNYQVPSDPHQECLVPQVETTPTRLVNHITWIAWGDESHLSHTVGV